MLLLNTSLVTLLHTELQGMHPWMFIITIQYVIYIQIEIFYHGITKGFTKIVKLKGGL